MILIVSIIVTVLDETQITNRGNNRYSFRMDGGSGQNFEISTVDLATNVSEECVVENITISTNPIVLFYANHTVLFWLIVATIVLVPTFIIFLIFFRRRKKDEEE